MSIAYLGLGSNLGSRAENIREAVRRLSETPGVRVDRVSSLYETSPVGLTEQPDFLNAVVRVETELPPQGLLRVLLSIERAMGRVRNIHWGPRVIDIDILLFDALAIEIPELTVPHPRMLERAFVLAPLAEIAPDLVLPDGRKPGDILASLADQRVRITPEAAECHFSDTR